MKYCLLSLTTAFVFAVSALDAAVSVGRYTAIDPNGGDWSVYNTTPSPYSMSVGAGNKGDIEVQINGVDPAFNSGFAATSSSESGYGNDNFVTAYNGANGLTLSTADNASGGGAITEQSSAASVAFFPYADGWFSGNMSGSLVQNGNTTGLSFSNPSVGTYRISGLSGTGNLLAFAQGNAGTASADNTFGVSYDGSAWVVESYDNDGTLQSGTEWGWIYIPDNATGIYSGTLDLADGTTTALNGAAASIGLTGANTGTGTGSLTIGDGSLINPANAALFLVGNENHSGPSTAGDNLYAYDASGNSFIINSQDSPNQVQEDGKVRFFVVPFDTLSASTAVPEPAHFALAFGFVALGGILIRRRMQR